MINNKEKCIDYNINTQKCVYHLRVLIVNCWSLSSSLLGLVVLAVKAHLKMYFKLNHLRKISKIQRLSHYAAHGKKNSYTCLLL